MSLSEEDKRRIQEEEEYRASIRAKSGGKASPKPGGCGCSSLILGLGIAFVFLVIISSMTPKPTPEQEARRKVEYDKKMCSKGETMAFTQATFMIPRILKSPSTAEFCSITEARIQPLGDCSYEVRGYVDAQNSFGAKLRNNFTATMKYLGNDNWTMTAIDIK